MSLLPTLAQAHPGHSVFDWFSGPPHAGHEEEYATMLIVLAFLGFGVCRLISQKR